MTIRWVTYFCPAGHALVFGHLVSKKGKFDSSSPTICGCGLVYNFADLTSNKTLAKTP